MTLPVAPPIDLAPLADLERATTSAPRHRSATLLAAIAVLAGAATGAVALAPRWAPPLVAIVRRKRTARRAGTPAIAGVVGLAAAGLARWQLQRLFTPEPVHTVELHDGGFEVRRYAPSRVAETIVEGARREALEEGFRRLADFIFGGNAGSQRIAMMAPVTSTQVAGSHTVSFALPEGVDLPKPTDGRIAIRPVASRRIAVLRFRGRYDDNAIEVMRRELAHRVNALGLKTSSEPAFAGYDPPWTLPALRRNEVWVEIDA
jgi:SOUL heme-binding protein